MTASASELDRVRDALRSSWSSCTSTLWTERNPARGQCSVTALALHELVGGEILKTRVGDAWHFYNRIDGVVVDFTAGRFEKLPEYLSIPATRSEALADTTPEQYQALLTSLRTLGIGAEAP